MNRRLFAIFIILGIVMLASRFSAVGCGSDGGGDGTKDPAGQEQTSVSETPDPLSPEGDLDGDGIANKDDPDADADGFDRTADCNDLDKNINPGIHDLPDGKGDTNCDGMDGMANAIWASKDEGSDANAGTVASPVENIARALELALVDPARPKDIYLVEGRYKEDVHLTGGVSMFGGFSQLVNGNRSRDTAAYTSIIDGIYDDIKITFAGKANTADFQGALFIDNSDSIVDGVRIEGGYSGTVVYIRNSTASVTNSIIETYDPTTKKKMAFAVVVTIDGNAKKDHTVTLSGNTIDLHGTFDTSESEFGVIALPEKDADLSLNLNIVNNTFNASGKSEATVAVFAADDQDAPAISQQKGDGKAGISLNVDRNRFNMKGDLDTAVAVVGGGMAMWSSIIPATENDFYLADMKVTGNIMSISATGMSVGIAGLDIRGVPVISNNIMAFDNKASGGMMGIVSSNSNIDVLSNTLYGTIKEGGYGVVFFTSKGPGNEYQSYSSRGPRDVKNNVISVVADPSCSSVIGVLEMGDDASISYHSSPDRFVNNDVHLPVKCSDPSKTVLYADMYNVPVFIMTEADLNDKLKFDPANKTVFNGNISRDPMFVDPAAGNFDLADGSPCIGLNMGALPR